ncbi:MAG: ATP-binding cassette domain-containing protein [Meiothermus sp.]|uniref:ATP-binding cassette domain-containing protein n=1 Tax=Meiothermus sp. TaxID=1955249 RepID=UPI00298F13EB|nr:ATP-binding cassette domain-containing protein [Meiothermus sp.]MDW8092003.1 ATP-binding cassette domain-containing protein [Meiothermus sp.]MDW8426409.1 ATP-binding cassette domain-containing protein [Meiothermus sp.]MDW8481602.1 ATP-binding cassette domain-containing protein [Meiothermus sp.]
MSLLELRQVTKRFGAVEVLRGVSFSLEAGSVVGLLGDNGAGKSTLMKIVTGVYSLDSGQVFFAGQPIRYPQHNPQRARELGIEMIYQDLALARQQDAAANIFLGREPLYRFLGFWPMIDRARMRREAEAAIARLGARLPSVSYPVGQLSGGQQQSVAIARALSFNPRLVIMDEPTAALAVREVEHVLELIRELRRQGIGVILISHRLPDVFAVSDRIVVLRQGVVVADLQTAQTSMTEVVGYIVGAH